MITTEVVSGTNGKRELLIHMALDEALMNENSMIFQKAFEKAAEEIALAIAPFIKEKILGDDRLLGSLVRTAVLEAKK